MSNEEKTLEDFINEKNWELAFPYFFGQIMIISDVVPDKDKIKELKNLVEEVKKYLGIKGPYTPTN